jgi:hypothetical protein
MPDNFVAGLSEAQKRSYPVGVALIPKSALSSKQTATAAVVASVVGLVTIPVLTVPAMLVAGFGWRSAPRWTRLTLIAGAILFAAYLVKANPAAHHG